MWVQGGANLGLVSPTLGRNEGSEPGKLALSPSRWSSSWSRFACISTWVCPHSPAVSGQRYFPGCRLPPPSVVLPSIRPSFLPTSILCGMWSGWFPSHGPPLCFPKITQSVRVFARWCCYLRSTQWLLPPEASGQEKAEAPCLSWCLVTIDGVSGCLLRRGGKGRGWL